MFAASLVPMAMTQHPANPVSRSLAPRDCVLLAGQGLDDRTAAGDLDLQVGHTDLGHQFSNSAVGRCGVVAETMPREMESPM